MEGKRQDAPEGVDREQEGAATPDAPRPEAGAAQFEGEPKKKGAARTRALAAVVALVLVLVAAAAGYRTLGDGGQASSSQADASLSSSSSAVDTEDEDDPFGVSSSETAQSSGFGSLADRNSTVFDADGNAVRVADLAAGQVCVINYWATWCPQCVDEFPDLARIYREYGDRVRFVFLNSTDGQRETVDKARAFLAKGGYEVPVYFDSKSNFGTDYRIEYLPTTFIVDADGTIVAASVGRVDPGSLTDRLDQLLG